MVFALVVVYAQILLHLFYQYMQNLEQGHFFDTRDGIKSAMDFKYVTIEWTNPSQTFGATVIDFKVVVNVTNKNFEFTIANKPGRFADSSLSKWGENLYYSFNTMTTLRLDNAIVEDKIQLDIFNFFIENIESARIQVFAVFSDNAVKASNVITLNLPRLLTETNLGWIQACWKQQIVLQTFAWCEFDFKFHLLSNCSADRAYAGMITATNLCGVQSYGLTEKTQCILEIAPYDEKRSACFIKFPLPLPPYSRNFISMNEDTKTQHNAVWEESTYCPPAQKRYICTYEYYIRDDRITVVIG